MNNRTYPTNNNTPNWLGKIPEHWRIVPGLSVFKENKRNNIGMKENRVLSLSYGKIIIKPIEKLVGLVPESFETYQIVKENDIIIRCTDLQNDKTSLRIGLVNDKGIITNAYLSLKVIEGNSSKFMYYFLHWLDVTKIIYGFGTGLRQNLSFADFRRMPIAVPPLSEQTRIAAFLDRKTALIDRAIASKEQEINLLKERRQIQIQQAVTGGLHQNAKNSPLQRRGAGGEANENSWLGNIPNHWEVVPGLTVFRENKRNNIGMKESKVLSLSYGCIIVKPLEKLIGLVPESFETYQIAKENDIIIRCTDLQNDKTSLRIGFVNEKGIITSAYLNLKVIGGHFPKYMYYFLNWLDVSKKIYSLGTGLRQNLSFADFKRMRIPIPPLSEQQEIVAYLEAMEEKTNKAISLKEQEIAKLKEYKTILIDATVRGELRIEN